MEYFVTGGHFDLWVYTISSEYNTRYFNFRFQTWFGKMFAYGKYFGV